MWRGVLKKQHHNSPPSATSTPYNPTHLPRPSLMDCFIHRPAKSSISDAWAAEWVVESECVVKRAVTRSFSFFVFDLINVKRMVTQIGQMSEMSKTPESIMWFI
jgi:hypothetical protein